ncbi:hypothetical protein ACO0RG_000460 [Hanseniaspora osmophila]
MSTSPEPPTTSKSLTEEDVYVLTYIGEIVTSIVNKNPDSAEVQAKIADIHNLISVASKEAFIRFFKKYFSLFQSNPQYQIDPAIKKLVDFELNIAINNPILIQILQDFFSKEEQINVLKTHYPEQLNKLESFYSFADQAKNIKKDTSMINLTNYQLLVKYLLKESTSTSFATSLDYFLGSFQGESLNEMIALLLSEIFCPGSQHFVPEISNWLTPVTDFEGSTQVGKQINEALVTLASQSSIGWSRVFNLMSTKYLIAADHVEPTLASLSSLFYCLNRGDLISQFFHCEWSTTLKLKLGLRLHDWNSSCFDLLSLDTITKVSSKFPNYGNSLLYLQPVSALILEIFFLRSELPPSKDLEEFTTRFFEDFNNFPENLLQCLMYTSKIFRLLVEDRAQIDDLMTSLAVQCFKKNFAFFDEIFYMIAAIFDQKFVKAVTESILVKYNSEIDQLAKSFISKNKFEFYVTEGIISFEDALQLFPSAFKYWSFDEQKTTVYKQFVKSKIQKSRTSVKILLNNLNNQINMDNNQKNSSSFSPLCYMDLDMLHFIFEELSSCSNLSPADFATFEDIKHNMVLKNPRLINFGYASSAKNEVLDLNDSFKPVSEEIEKGMQQCLQKMYSKEITIKVIIEMMQDLSSSKVKADQELFCYIIHGVISESPFYKDYPLDAVALNSVLLGSLINVHLIRGFVLDVVLRLILSFSTEPSDSKLFKFAVQALFDFKDRLVEFPDFCKRLLNSSFSLQTHPVVYDMVIKSVQEQEKQTLPKSTDVEVKYLVPVEPRTQIVQEAPSKDIQDKVLFNLNNISIENHQEKTKKLKEFLKPNYFEWFAITLINQRAKTEPNYHELYSKVIFLLNDPLLHDYVLFATYTQTQKLMSKGDISPQERNYVKNLGGWLGFLTLAKNQPIKNRNLAVRELLIESFNDARLEVIVPFVCKLLAHAASSVVFNLPNVWTNSIIELLVELNEKANWPLKLTFEVEVLLQVFNKKVNDFKASDLLSNPKTDEILSGKVFEESADMLQSENVLRNMIQQQTVMFLHNRMQQQQRAMGQNGVNNNLSQLNDRVNSLTLDQKQQIQQKPASDASFQNLMGNTIFVTHPDLRHLFHMAISKSVREILVQVVEKSSRIAVVTTTQLVLKDFATDADELKLKDTAVAMARQLAKKMAYVSCVEILRENIKNTTQSLCANIMNMIPQAAEELLVAVNENIGLALNLIENASMERANQEVLEVLMQPMAIRGYHKEKRAEENFVAPNVSPYAELLPEPLGLKAGGVTAQQLKIYEEFGQMGVASPSEDILHMQQQQQQQQQQQDSLLEQQKLKHRNVLLQQLRQDNGQQAQSQEQKGPPGLETIHGVTMNNTPMNVHAQPAMFNQPVIQPPPMNELKMQLDSCVHLIENLTQLVKENAEKKISDFGTENNPVTINVLRIISILARSKHKDSLALTLSQNCVSRLFQLSTVNLGIEAFTMLIDKICNISVVAKKDVAWWLVYAVDPRKLSVSCILSLIDCGLIQISSLDKMLTALLRSNLPHTVSFSIELISEILQKKDVSLIRTNFLESLIALKDINSQESKEALEKLLELQVMPVSSNTSITQRERLFLVFTEWVNLVQKADTDDFVVRCFIQQLIDRDVVDSTEKVLSFLDAGLEMSVESFKNSDPTSDVFTAIDALTKFVIQILVYQDFSFESREEFLRLLLIRFQLHLSTEHKKPNDYFNERPFFRFLSSLLFEWQKVRSHDFISISDQECRSELKEFDDSFYFVFSDFIHALQPLAYPSFAFAWVTLISHRMYLPTMLKMKDNKGWVKVNQTFVYLFRYFDKYSGIGQVPDSVAVLYKGVLRVALAIFNDVPEYFIENHFVLLNNLPSSYLQLRNLILSAIPKKMCFPNPYNRNIEISDIPECTNNNPSQLYNTSAELGPLKKPIESYLRIPSSSLMRNISNQISCASRLEEIKGFGFDITTIDRKLLNAVVMHIGEEAGNELLNTSKQAILNVKSSYYMLLSNLIANGKDEFIYYMIDCMVNQLRYPNAQTFFFHYTLTTMFKDGTSSWSNTKKNSVQEIILRALLERLLVHKPHPWGCVLTFLQLLNTENILDLDCVKNSEKVSAMLKTVIKYLDQSKTAAEKVQDPPVQTQTIGSSIQV